MARPNAAPTSGQATPPPITGMPGPGGRGGGATKIEKPRSAKGVMRRLLDTLRPHRIALAGVVALVVISTALDLAAPFLMGRAIDQFIATRDLGGLKGIALLMAGAYAGSWLLNVA